MDGGCKVKCTYIFKIMQIMKAKLEPNPKKLDIMKIKGAFGKEPKDFDWKKIKTEYLLKKYVI